MFEVMVSSSRDPIEESVEIYSFSASLNAYLLFYLFPSLLICFCAFTTSFRAIFVRRNNELLEVGNVKTFGFGVIVVQLEKFMDELFLDEVVNVNTEGDELIETQLFALIPINELPRTNPSLTIFIIVFKNLAKLVVNTISELLCRDLAIFIFIELAEEFRSNANISLFNFHPSQVGKDELLPGLDYTIFVCQSPDIAPQVSVDILLRVDHRCARYAISRFIFIQGLVNPGMLDQHSGAETFGRIFNKTLLQEVDSEFVAFKPVVFESRVFV